MSESILKMRALLLTAGSFVLTAGVLTNAYYQKKQFYPSVVYITKSSPNLAVLYLQALVFVVLMGKLMRKIFFGQLRAAEMEHLIERSWYAVTETCLAFTVFRDDFSPRFVALFTVLLFLKCFHWLAEDRVDYMERSPVISWLFHIRVTTLVSFLGTLDCYFIGQAYYSTLMKGASAQLVFGFEYAILLTVAVHISFKYTLHAVDLQSENPWESKAVYLLYTELVIGFIKVVLYTLFLAIMIKVHTFPLFAIRPMYLTMRELVTSIHILATSSRKYFLHDKRTTLTFKKSLNDVILSRRAIRNMNTLYPDATEEELSSGDNVCIICREEMTQGCKKLPCNHIFHASCLRSWFQRQQTCPTCRMDILNPPSATARTGQQRPRQPDQPQPPPPGPHNVHPQPQMGGFYPGLMPPFPMFPQPQQQPGANGTTTTTGSTATTSTAAPSTATTAGHVPTAAPSGGMPMWNAPSMMMPFMFPGAMGVPMPMPAPDFSGMTEEEVRTMEGRERRNVEARIECLRNIQVLLDAAMVQMQQYTSVVNSLGLSRDPSRDSTSFPAASGGNSNKTATSAADGASATSSSTVITTDGTTSISSSSGAERSVSSSQLDTEGLEGAVGHSPVVEEEIADWTESTTEQEETLTEIRRRRLEKFTASNSSQYENNEDTKQHKSKLKDNFDLD